MTNHTTSVRLELDFYLNTALKLKAKEAGLTKKEYITQLIQQDVKEKSESEVKAGIEGWTANSKPKTSLPNLTKN